MEPLKSPFTLSRGGFVKINLSGRKENASAFGVKRRGVFKKQLGVLGKGRILFKILVLSARSVQIRNFAPHRHSVKR